MTAGGIEPSRPEDENDPDQPPAERLERSRAIERARARGGRREHHSPDLRLTEKAFAALADNVRDYAVFLMDPHGVITFWGEGARLMKGWSQAEAEGAHLRLLYPEHGSEDGTAEENLDEAAAQGEYTGEGHRVRPDGSTFWAGVTLTALRSEEGELLGFAKVTRDLTAQRASESILQAAAEASETARAAAVAASNAKSGFLATMSHEIRTPINAVLGYADLLDVEITGPLTPGQRAYVSRVRASARHLLGLVDEILDLSRLEAGRVSVRERAFRVGDVVDASLALVEPQARLRQIQIRSELSGDAARLACWGDEARVRQVLANLLVNAVKFTDIAGSVGVSAGTAAEPPAGAVLGGPGPWVFLRVEDTGRGIPPEQLSGLFEPFVQGDMALTRRYGGSGLGLAISRRLARLMGGDITVSSEPGVGSAFTVWLASASEESMRSGVRARTVISGPEHRSGADQQRPPGTLRELAAVLLADTDRVLHAVTARLRADAAVPSASATSEADLEDHIGTLIADLAPSLNLLEAGRGASPESLHDGADIQRVVATRHGGQRARLGWDEDEVRREHEILREELAAAVRRRAARGDVRDANTAIAVLHEFLAQAERLSLQSFARAAEERR